MRHIEIKDQVGIKRKCGCCGENFYISKDNIDDAIYYDKKTYHSSCFISMCHKRSEMKRVDISQKWTWVLNHLDSIKNDSYSHMFYVIEKEGIFNFIKETYDISRTSRNYASIVKGSKLFYTLPSSWWLSRIGTCG